MNAQTSMYCNITVSVLGEAGTHLAARCPSQPDRDLWRLGRETKRPRLLETWSRDQEAETFGDLAERPRGQDLYRLVPRGRDLRRLNWDGRRPQVFGRLAPWESGRWPNPLQLTLKPRSVKLIHHQELGNATLSGIHPDKRAQQGRPIRII